MLQPTVFYYLLLTTSYEDSYSKFIYNINFIHHYIFEYSQYNTYKGIMEDNCKTCDNRELNDLDDEYYSQQTFNELNLYQGLVDEIIKNGYNKMTKIQSKCIPHLLMGRDIMALAKTGSL